MSGIDLKLFSMSQFEFQFQIFRKRLILIPTDEIDLKRLCE